MSMYSNLEECIKSLDALHHLIGTDSDDPAQESLYNEIVKDLKQAKADCLVLMERNQELYDQNEKLREWKRVVTHRISLIIRRKPSVALDEIDVLSDDIKFKRKDL